MSKLLSLIVAGVFAISGGAALAASHTGGKMDDKKDEKSKMEKKGEEKKMEKKGEEKKGEEKKMEKKGEEKKMEKKAEAKKP